MMRMKDFLKEIFDDPWKLEKLNSGDTFEKLKSKITSLYPDHKRLSIFKATDNEGDHKGFIVEFAKDFFMEIHHFNKNLESGMLDAFSSKSNSRFVGTIKRRVDHYTKEKSFGVRIVANPTMINQYHKIVKSASKGRYHVSEIEHISRPGLRDGFAFKISPPRIIDVG